MRLDKFIAHKAYHSRKGSKKAIRNGLVTVNGKIVQDYDFEITGKDVITLEGKTLTNTPYTVLMLNKPSGYMCSMKDEKYPSVMNLLPEEMRTHIRMVGRLDQDTTGLLLLTDNGELNMRLAHPKTKVEKKYYVTVNHPLKKELIPEFLQPIDIGNNEIAHPTKFEIVDTYHAYISVEEGKYHEVKRIFSHFYYFVTELKRVALGPITLGALKEGEYRELEENEVDALLVCAKLEKVEQL